MYVNFYTFSIHVNILLIKNQNVFQQKITQYLYVLALASCVAFILHLVCTLFSCSVAFAHKTFVVIGFTALFYG